MFVITSYRRFDGETDEELIYRVTGDKDKIGSWQDVADILNELLGTEYTESKFRKQRQAFDKMLAANRNKFVNDSVQLEEIRLAQRELERSKIQIRDERRSWQKQNYIDSRFDEVMNLLIERLDNFGKTEFRSFPRPLIGTGKSMIVLVNLILKYLKKD